MKILIIDDDRAFTQPLLWRLRREGHDVEHRESVEDVLDEEGKLKMPKPDCILLDVMMPRGDRYSKSETEAGANTGLRLLRDIYKQNENIPVVIISVRRDLNKSELQKKFGDGIKEVLEKPVTPTMVVTRLDELFPKAS
jgi:CheY-like chemotaxis protein